jgi:glucosamine-6-phosphate deaminase
MNQLSVAKDTLGKGSPIKLEILPDDSTLIHRFAADIITEYQAAKSAGREKVVFILPVGPVGQYDLVAQICNEKRINLSDLVIINMDEYLTPDGSEFISSNDPLSFHRHMEDHFYRKLDQELCPPLSQRIFPSPADLEAVPQLIEDLGGCDVCFGGIGITGHVAFNDPPEPGERITLESFAALSTRVVSLSRETLLINSVTTCRGNIDRIPKLAVTVGMKEILDSFKVRIYLNRHWQSAIVRKILHGPVTPNVPASLLQNHPDVFFAITDYVAEIPEPQLS